MELPSELLVNIGTFADGKTINSMSRASRRFNGVVENNRLILPKCAVDLKVEYRERSKTTTFVVKVWPTDKNSKLYAYGQQKRCFVAKLLDGDSNETDEQKRKLVAQFYEESAEAHLSTTEQSFPFGLSTGLDLHLDYILRKVHFRNVCMWDLIKEQHVVVFRQLQRYRSKVDHMDLGTSIALPLEVMPPANIVKSLDIVNPPHGFYRLPSVRQLNYLAVSSCSDRLLEDGDLCQLRATELWIDSGGWKVTERGIRDFITQWCEGKRKIKLVDLFSEIETEDAEAEREKWQKMAESLSPELVRVAGEADSGKSDYWQYTDAYQLMLIRLSDDEKLILGWGDGIKLYNPWFSYGDANLCDLST